MNALTVYLFFPRLRHIIRVVEKKYGDLFIRLFTDIQATMNTIGRFIPIHLSWRHLEAFSLSRIAIFDGDGISA